MSQKRSPKYKRDELMSKVMKMYFNEKSTKAEQMTISTAFGTGISTKKREEND